MGMRQPPPAQDPMARLAKAEQNIQYLTNQVTLLKQENQGLQARVKQLEVECGLAQAGEDADDSGIG